MYRSCRWQKIPLFVTQADGKRPYSKWFHTQLLLPVTFFIVTLCPYKLFIKSNKVQLIRKSCYFIPQFLQHFSAHTEPSSRRTTLPELFRVQNQILLRRALQLFISFGPLNNSIPLLSIDSHLTLIPNFTSFQILSDIILPSQPQSSNSAYCNSSPLCYSFHRLFLSMS